ncbi:inositol 5-phosphatase, putative [Bodo saltans]|uniref:Inositol 5-phosphatase, putative n=1 Tax=Bodo saltans TaxID=75058 RepID=A0A0S4IWG8_BODSA|nr:inositol 5-phosphatase, putative [Bodo saltans]|eukprot:CUG29095.1 inositol 5-phosphatase, putative [Bodo saltans]
MTIARLGKPMPRSAELLMETRKQRKRKLLPTVAMCQVLTSSRKASLLTLLALLSVLVRSNQLTTIQTATKTLNGGRKMSIAEIGKRMVSRESYGHVSLKVEANIPESERQVREEWFRDQVWWKSVGLLHATQNGGKKKTTFVTGRTTKTKDPCGRAMKFQGSTRKVIVAQRQRQNWPVESSGTRTTAQRALSSCGVPSLMGRSNDARLKKNANEMILHNYPIPVAIRSPVSSLPLATFFKELFDEVLNFLPVIPGGHVLASL